MLQQTLAGLEHRIAETQLQPLICIHPGKGCLWADRGCCCPGFQLTAAPEPGAVLCPGI